MIWIGIDPGVYGALAILLPEEALVFDTPTVAATVGRDYLPAEMAALLRPYAGGRAILEKESTPRAMGGEKTGGISARGGVKIGYGVGLWVGILTTLGIAYERPTPQAWRKSVGIPVGAEKDFSRLRAQALYPVQAPLLARKKDHGRAEALLMATYGFLRWGGGKR